MALLGLGAPLAAQGPGPVADSIPRAVKPPVSPGGALWRSLLVPGWGQLALRRPVVAALFGAAEVATVSLAVRENGTVGDLRRQLAEATSAADSTLLRDRLGAATRRREDFYVFIGVNHVLAGLEALVAGHLADFPADLKLRVYPDRATVSGRLPLRWP